MRGREGGAADLQRLTQRSACAGVPGPERNAPGPAQPRAAAGSGRRRIAAPL